ncbi:hypothetical protein CPB85DRAFT_1564724, partial [Mucidula mucida]
MLVLRSTKPAQSSLLPKHPARAISYLYAKRFPQDRDVTNLSLSFLWAAQYLVLFLFLYIAGSVCTTISYLHCPLGLDHHCSMHAPFP